MGAFRPDKSCRQKTSTKNNFVENSTKITNKRLLFQRKICVTSFVSKSKFLPFLCFVVDTSADFGKDSTGAPPGGHFTCTDPPCVFQLNCFQHPPAVVSCLNCFHNFRGEDLIHKLFLSKKNHGVAFLIKHLQKRVHLFSPNYYVHAMICADQLSSPSGNYPCGVCLICAPFLLVLTTSRETAFILLYA